MGISAKGLLIAQVISSVESEAAGPSYTVPALCQALAGQGGEVCLFTIGTPLRAQADGFRHVRVAESWTWPAALRKFRYSRHLDPELRHFKPDVIHSHGIWEWPNVTAHATAKALGKPHVLSPRGMLGREALQFSRWKKMALWHGVQRRVFDEIACFHATSDLEYRDIRALGLTRPVAIIPNGIDLPKELSCPQEKHDRTVLSLGRLHPKKGLERLISAWGAVENRHPDWSLKIVGPGSDDYVRELRHLIATSGSKRASIGPAVFGEDKQRLFRQADLFVLTSLNENFAVTVPEALASGVPVLCTDGSPWSGLNAEGCGWWVPSTLKDLERKLDEVMTLRPCVLQDMGRLGRLWMQRDFGWTSVACQMISVYLWLTGRSDMPDCVRLD
jgi:glycosyltransferase involved in cell wall biosynthesis